jgi:hypothetical protein
VQASERYAGDTNVDLDASIAPWSARRCHRWRMFARRSGHRASEVRGQSTSRAQEAFTP